MDKLITFYEEHKNLVLVGVVVLVLAGGFLWFASDSHPDSVAGDNPSQAAKKPKHDDSVPDAGTKQLFVDVKGAVNKPGVYQVTPNMRVNAAIELAQGFNASADVKQLNMAQRVSDQMVIYVPIKGEIKKSPVQTIQSGEESGSPTNESGSAKVNLNSADKTKLTTLNGIGEKKAEKIIDFRKTHGEFKTVNDLTKVPGFGDKTVQNLKSSIAV